MDVRILNGIEEIGNSVAEIIAQQVNAKADSVIGFATGASPVPTYKNLVSRYNNGELSLKNIITFNLDEYCGIPQDCAESYHTFMYENLFGLTDVQDANVNFLDGNAEDFKAECDRYQKKIADCGGIDIQLLGIGTNGHIGFNEPGDAFSDGPFAVELTESTKTSNAGYFSDGIVPDYALTMGVGDILRARKIILIATGASKAKAIAAMINGEVSPSCPASVLQQHADVVVFLDEAAASLL